MPMNGLDPLNRDFLLKLFDQTNGDSAVQVSMYDIGSALGLERDASSQTAQTLIGLDLVEIKTLSGGIGITAQGIETVAELRGTSGGAVGGRSRLSNARVLTSTDVESLGQFTGYLKSRAGSLGLDFENLTELVADLRSIDAQMVSSQPKTAIVRECLRSIETVLAGAGDSEAQARLNNLLGE